MGKFREGVGGYRGRRTITDLLKLLAILLSIAVIVVLAGFLFGQRYIVYSDEGLRLELPFFQKEEVQPPELGPENINMIERPGDAGEEADGNLSPEESAYVMSALELAWEDLSNGSAAGKLEQAGANAVILTMKDAQGNLSWESRNALAQAIPVNGDPAVNAALEQWLQGEVYTIAKVCCFRDNTIPYHRNNLALRATYGNWRDELGLRWMNPAGADTQAYLEELCRELAEMGFDEILLECYAFPEEGVQESITTQAPEGRTKAAEDFLRQVRRAANENGAKLSVVVEPGVLGEAESISGVTIGLLCEQAECLWVNRADAAAVEGALAEEADERLVMVQDVLQAEPTGNQAAFIEK